MFVWDIHLRLDNHSCQVHFIIPSIHTADSLLLHLQKRYLVTHLDKV